MAQFGAAISFYTAPFNSVAGARRNFQRRRQKHLLRLRAGLVLFGGFFPSTATTDDSNEDAATNVATDSGLLLPTYTPSVRADQNASSASADSNNDNGDGGFLSAGIATTNWVSSARKCAATTVAASGEPDSNTAVYYNGDGVI